jgi:CRP/FNR family transcriptional regulator, cyclic AMP receptor protein
MQNMLPPLMKLFGPRKLTSRLAQLAQISLFSRLSPAELDIVEGLLHQREYLADEVVFDEGEEGQAIYIVQQGEVVLCRQGEGEGGLIGTLGPGEFFGDLALLDNLPRAAQARATQPTRLAALFREDFLGLMDTHARIASKIALQLAREMGRRIRHMQGGESQLWRQHL